MESYGLDVIYTGVIGSKKKPRKRKLSLKEAIHALMVENNQLYFINKSENPSNSSILESFTLSNPARNTKELLTRVIYKHLDNDDDKIILDPQIFMETKSPIILALGKARISPKDVLTVSKWSDVFHDHTLKDREFLRGVSLGAEEYFQEEIQKVSEAGKASGSREATEHIFNEAGRKKIKDDLSFFLSFPEDYQDYLIKHVNKSDSKKSWKKWLFREIFGKNVWLKWLKDPHIPKKTSQVADFSQVADSSQVAEKT